MFAVLCSLPAGPVSVTSTISSLADTFMIIVVTFVLKFVEKFITSSHEDLYI